MIWLLYLAAFGAGAIIGSFLNVVIHRGPAMWGLVDEEARKGNLAYPGSYCPACFKPLHIFHLFPIISYLGLRGKCASCGVKISRRYPLIELAGALAPVAAFAVFGFSFEAVSAMVFLWLLLALAAIDWETGYLPDALTFTLIFSGLAVNMIDAITPLPDALIGAVAGYLVFRVIGAVFHQVRGVEGLGQGDAKLLAGIGAWLGWLALPVVVLAGALLGLLAAGVLHMRGKEISPQTALPFGPALTAGAALALFFNAL